MKRMHFGFCRSLGQSVNLVWLLIVLTAVLGSPSNAFDLNVSKKNLYVLLDKTTVDDLVVGDSSFVSWYFLCKTNGKLYVLSDAENVDKELYGYSVKLKRVVGNSFDAILIPPDGLTKDMTGNFLSILQNRTDCTSLMEADPDRTTLEIRTINGFNNLSKLVASLMYSR